MCQARSTRSQITKQITRRASLLPDQQEGYLFKIVIVQAFDIPRLKFAIAIKRKHFKEITNISKCLSVEKAGF